MKSNEAIPRNAPQLVPGATVNTADLKSSKLLRKKSHQQKSQTKNQHAEGTHLGSKFLCERRLSGIQSSSQVIESAGPDSYSGVVLPKSVGRAP